MPHPTRDEKPNILWVCTDSQRWDTLGCAGQPWTHTPVADRLAAEGVRCSHAFAQNPLCQPSRGCFLTGRYPTTNRLRMNGQDAPADLVTVPRLLRDAGYLTGLAGKLHLSACDNRLRLGPEWWREPEWTWHRGGEPRIDDGYDVLDWDHAPSGQLAASAYTRFLHGRGVRGQPEPRPDCRWVRRGRPAELHPTTWCVDRALEFLTAAGETPRPWLYSVNLFDPHAPWDPPEACLARYLGRLDEIPLPDVVAGELDTKPRCQRRVVERGNNGHPWAEMTPRDHRLIRAAYWAMCDFVDVQLGRLLEGLARTGQRERTLVVFMSDHGELLGDHGIYIKGPMLYDAALRVPLVFSWPGTLAGGRTLDGLVELGDLAPTLLEAAGLPRHPGMQARSLWPALAGTGGAEAAAGREDVYAEYANSNPDQPPVFLSMVRTATHKLVAAPGEDLGELYDLAADPGEHVNLWRDPAALPLRAGLLERLAHRLTLLGDPLPPRVGVY